MAIDIGAKSVFSEVVAFFKILDKTYIDMLPIKLIKFFEDNINKEYMPELKTDIPLNEQNLSRDAIVIISKIYLQYWLKDEKKQDELIALYLKNDENK